MKSLFVIIALVFMVGFPRAIAQRSGGVSLHINFHPVQILTVNRNPETLEHHLLERGEKLWDIISSVKHELLTVHTHSPLKLAITKKENLVEHMDNQPQATHVLYSIEIK